MMERHYKVLFIEDDEDDYVVVRDMLSESVSSKFDLDWVQTYEAGLSAACGSGHDVVLLDYQLGDRNGIELLREIVARGCEAPVILLTGQGGYDVDMEAMRAGATDYLVKGDVTEDNLDRTIRYSIERKHAENELRKYRDHLESLVRERTVQIERANGQLERANEALQLEIEERKRAEEALKESEERHRVLVENALDLIYTASPEGKIVSLNPAFELITGWRPSEWIGKDFTPLFHPDDLPRLTERIKRLLAGEVLSATDARVRSRFGGYRTIEFKTVQLGKDGKVIGVMGTARDVTERKQMEEALRRARDELEERVEERTADLARANEMLRAEIEERKKTERALRLDESRLEALFELSRMTESTPEQIADFVLEEQVKLTRSKVGWLGFMNEDETAVNLHAWSREVMKQCGGTGEEMHFSIDEAGVWADAVKERRAVVINDYSEPNPHKLGCPRGHVPLRRLLVCPIFEGNRIVAVGAVANKEEGYDSTDVRQHTLLLDGMWKLIQRERALKALLEAEGLAAMGRALSSLAHDMKTPLIAIGGFTHLAHRHMEETNPHRKKLEIVLKETRRLEALVRDMLDFSRHLDLDRSPEDVEQLVSESLVLLDSMAKEREVSIRSDTEPDLPPASVDPLRMKQVLVNLAVNAVQASPDGETVTVRAYARHADLFVDVVDHGPGIPFEKRHEIFTPFYTTKREGTGLGLPIAKKIVGAHKGRIEILDNPDGGLTFRVVLPGCLEEGKNGGKPRIARTSIREMRRRCYGARSEHCAA